MVAMALLLITFLHSFCYDLKNSLESVTIQVISRVAHLKQNIYLRTKKDVELEFFHVGPEIFEFKTCYTSLFRNFHFEMKWHRGPLRKFRISVNLKIYDEQVRCFSRSEDAFE